MRPFLAFDTATDHLALAVGDLDVRDSVVAAIDFPAPRAANTVLLPAAERLLVSCGFTSRDLAAVAVGRGPGSFTGVRIGVSTAKGLAHGLGVPLVGFGTLDAVAWRVSADGLIGVVGDAMRGEVYPALYRASAGALMRLDADRVSAPDEAAREWSALGEGITLSGGGLAKHAAVFEREIAGATLAPARSWAPDGASLIAAAWSAEGDATITSIASAPAASAYAEASPGALLPVYTRLSDAEEAERRSGSGPLPASGVAGPRGGAR